MSVRVSSVAVSGGALEVSTELGGVDEAHPRAFLTHGDGLVFFYLSDSEREQWARTLFPEAFPEPSPPPSETGPADIDSPEYPEI